VLLSRTTGRLAGVRSATLDFSFGLSVRVAEQQPGQRGTVGDEQNSCFARSGRVGPGSAAARFFWCSAPV
jgi:hypothetical protein